MSDYEMLLKRVGQAAVDRLVQAGLFEAPEVGAPEARAAQLHKQAINEQNSRLASALLKSRTRFDPSQLPHAIPYQGSKRSLAPFISRYIPSGIDCWYEPFAGSAAMTIWAANQDVAERFVLGEVLIPLADLWRLIISDPEMASARYAEVWHGQAPGDTRYFYDVRERFNDTNDPIDLLYLICRCVKNAVRFGRAGNFTQSVDKRRLGMRPEKMAFAMRNISLLLLGRTEVRSGDWLITTADAGETDFIYLDPPYFGTTEGRDKRYAEQLARERLEIGLADLNAKRVRFALSYDGMTGERVYAQPLPAELELTHILVHAGRSSQSTLIGRDEKTIESLYLSRGSSHHVDRIVQGSTSQFSLSLAS